MICICDWNKMWEKYWIKKRAKERRLFSRGQMIIRIKDDLTIIEQKMFVFRRLELFFFTENDSRLHNMKHRLCNIIGMFFFLFLTFMVLWFTGTLKYLKLFWIPKHRINMNIDGSLVNHSIWCRNILSFLVQLNKQLETFLHSFYEVV